MVSPPWTTSPRRRRRRTVKTEGGGDGEAGVERLEMEISDDSEAEQGEDVEMENESG